MGNVVSDTSGKSSKIILDKILENPLDTSFDIKPLIHGSMKNKNSDILPVEREITVEQAILIAQYQGYKIKSAT